MKIEALLKSVGNLIGLEMKDINDAGIKIVVKAKSGKWLYNKHGFNAFWGVRNEDIEVKWPKQRGEIRNEGGRPPVSEELKEEIRKRGQQGKSCRTIAQELGISKSTVGKYLK